MILSEFFLGDVAEQRLTGVNPEQTLIVKIT